MALYHPVKIGNLSLQGNLFLAPVAGYTDRAFRSICVEQGANFSYTELVSAEALVRGNQNSIEMLSAATGEENYAVQIFGANAQTIFRATQIVLEKSTCKCIDINCGCPVPKVVKTGAGAALTRDTDRLYEIAKATVDASECRVPVSVKIRSAWDASHSSWQEAADAALSAGVNAITMHPRSRAQGYEGKADWGALAKLVEHVKAQNPETAVFGSGDLFSPEDALKMLEQTKCDGVMFARGAMGNPFIFSQTRALLTDGKYTQVSPECRLQTGLKELDLLIAEIGEQKACREMRKRFCAYTKGVAGSATMRGAFVQAQTKADYVQLCKRGFN